MLIVKIVNDLTGNINFGNYNFSVFINRELVGKGRIEGHYMSTGWRGLLTCLAKVVNDEERRTKNEMPNIQ